MPRNGSSHKISPKPTVPTVIKPIPSAIMTPPPTSFGQIVKEGFGFGAGSALAHRAVAAVLGPTTTQTILTPTPSETKATCVSERVAFESCLKTRANEDQCNNEFLSYKQCIEFK